MHRLCVRGKLELRSVVLGPLQVQTKLRVFLISMNAWCRGNELLRFVDRKDENWFDPTDMLANDQQSSKKAVVYYTIVANNIISK